MDDFLNAVWRNEPYTLSYEGDKPTVVIPSDVLQYCGKPDMFVLDFLYQSYKKHLNGVILNEEEDQNPQLQLSTFLGAIHKTLKIKPVILVLCPDDAVVKWHYYMTCCGIFEIKVVTSETVSEDISEDIGMVLLLSFSNIKLAESLMEYNFFSVIIDRFDEVATKMIIRKLQSNFNIGVTYRNFYTKPDQKLQWTMLNWANPGCVGKLADFYETDSDNFANFRDNYKEWWYRITWNFCESFVRPTLEEKGNVSKILREWAKQHNLSKYSLMHSERRSKRKTTAKVEKQSEKNDSEEENAPKRMRKVYSKKTNKIPYSKKAKEIKIPKNDCEASDSANSSDTIIYEAYQHTNLMNELVEDCEEDEPPIGPIKDKDDKASVSSEECDEKPKPQEKVKLSLKGGCQQDTTIEHIDDESDTFLKSVATKQGCYINRIQSAEQFVNDILGEGASEKKQVDLELSDADFPVESDKFLKEICSQKSQETYGTCVKNNNYASSSMSDVDSLVAEVMEMVRK